jgi:hypothetical protein
MNDTHILLLRNLSPEQVRCAGEDAWLGGPAPEHKANPHAPQSSVGSPLEPSNLYNSASIYGEGREDQSMAQSKLHFMLIRLEPPHRAWSNMSAYSFLCSQLNLIVFD